MMLIKLLMIPFKLVLKLALYSVGGIIFGVMFILSAVVATISGLLKTICSAIIMLIIVGGTALIITEPEVSVVVLSVLALVFFILLSIAPDILMKIFMKISDLSYKLFDVASFKLYKRKEYIIVDNNYEFVDGELRRKDNNHDNRIMVRI